MGENMYFSKVCRTCLSTDELSSIFDDSEDQELYRTIIFNISGLKVEKDDSLPQQICKNCSEFLNQTQAFRQKCLDTDQLLRTANKPEALQIILEIEEIDIDVQDEKVVKPEQKDDFDEKVEYEMEYIDFEILEEEDKPLKYLKNTEIALDKNESTEKELNIKESYAKTDLLYSISSQNRVTCKLCSKNLSIRSVDSHMSKKHPGVDERRLKCELCDKYILKSKVNRHMRLSHSVSVAEKCFRCSYCKAEFADKEALVDHVTTCIAKIKKRSIHEPGRQLVECDECKKTMQRASLKMHKAVTHAGLGPVCEHCGKRFSNKLRLKEHCRARHGYEKLKCSYCDFASASEVALKNHERRHRNEKPFVCEACGAKFHAAYLLAQHRQSHRTEKLLKCNLCPASFKANNSLHTHKRLCHSETQHACNLCGRAYASRHYVARHLRRRHKINGPISIPNNTKANKEQE